MGEEDLLLHSSAFSCFLLNTFSWKLAHLEGAPVEAPKVSFLDLLIAKEMVSVRGKFTVFHSRPYFAHTLPNLHLTTDENLSNGNSLS